MSIQPHDLSKKNSPSVEIFTLGQFAVKRGDKIISEEMSRSSKLWELFKYLLTHREKPLHPETILENLWPEQEYTDRQHALRNLIHRLRHLLNDNTGSIGDLIFSQGCYHWTINEGCWLDTVAFENLCQEAASLAREDSTLAIEKYQEAVALYRGDYLPECLYSEWVTPVRNYYRRIYLQSALKLTELLKSAHMYAEVIELCEKVFLLEPFEEEFHLHFIETLLEDGKLNQTRSHYEYVTSLFYRELGVKPSPSMRELYYRLQGKDNRAKLDLTSIRENILKEKEIPNGVLFCSQEIFCFLCKLEKRRAERTGQVAFLGLLTILKPDYTLPPPNALKRAAETLKEVLSKNLRKGDVISMWNENQFLLMMSGLNQKQAEKALQRVTRVFAEHCSSEDIILRCRLQPI